MTPTILALVMLITTTAATPSRYRSPRSEAVQAIMRSPVAIAFR
jgi:hypothetical protein